MTSKYGSRLARSRNDWSDKANQGISYWIRMNWRGHKPRLESPRNPSAFRRQIVRHLLIADALLDGRSAVLCCVATATGGTLCLDVEMVGGSQAQGSRTATVRNRV
jgi:hypothetical protein